MQNFSFHILFIHIMKKEIFEYNIYVYKMRWSKNLMKKKSFIGFQWFQLSEKSYWTF